MYLEFLYIFLDYFSTLKKRTIVFEWGLPILTGTTCMFLSYLLDINSQYIIIEKSFEYVGILLGFTLAALTLLLSNDKMKDARGYQTDVIIRGRKASLYDLVIISFTYLILIECFLCIGFLIAQLFNFIFIEKLAICLNSLYIILLFNILMTTIRTITDMYFILIKK